MLRFRYTGVDGIQVDREFHGYNFSLANLGNGLRSATRIVGDQGTALGIRLANRSDNPFVVGHSVQILAPHPPVPVKTLTANAGAKESSH